MNQQLGYLLFKDTCAVLATIGLYSVLYRENKLYRFFEHMFVGLAAGWGIVALWQETLYSLWWTKMLGSTPDAGSPHGSNGYWLYVLLLPLGMMGYLVFHRKHNWISRIPIGIILGLWSGQQPSAWYTQYWPQIASSMKPIIPTTFDRFTQPNTSLMLVNGQISVMPPDTAKALNVPVYPAEAIGNIVFIITLLTVISYFLFSIDIKNKALQASTTIGRWLLMVGFGAIFGSTVMMRFSLLIDRMHFILIEWMQKEVIGTLFHH